MTSWQSTMTAAAPVADWRQWRRGGGLAAQTSQVPAWQQYLDGYGRSGRSLADPADRPAASLASAETSYGNRQVEAAALGMPDEGEAAPGLLNTALRGLDWFRASAFNTVRELVEPGFDIDRLRQRVDDREGFGDLEALQMDDDDGWGARAGKGVAAFLGDVATDPLTYLTFGGAAVGRRAASEVVESGTRTVARGLDDQVIERFAQRSMPQRAVDVARREVGDESADRMAEAVLRRPASFAGDDASWRRSLGTDAFAAEASEAYLGGGSRGLRRWLTSELGDEAGDQAFRSLPRDVQGGLNLRAPLVRRDVDGVRTPVTVGVGGGGRTVDRLGVGHGVQAAHDLRNAVRSSRLGRAVGDRLGGRDGALYGAVVRDLARDPDDLGRATTAQYAAVRRARLDAGAYDVGAQRNTVRVLAVMDSAVQNASDRQAAEVARDQWFANPAGLRALTEADVAGLSDVERAGVAAARAGHDLLDRQLVELRRLGLSVGQIDEYVPRILADAEREVRRAAGRGSGQRRGGASSDPTRSRQRYATLEVLDAGDGTPTIGHRWMTPAEANEASGRPVFETDALKAVGRYADATRKLATRTRFAQLLAESGTIVSDPTVAGRAGRPAWRRAIAGVEDSAVQITDAPVVSTLRQAFEEVFADVPEAQAGQVWSQVFDGDRVTVPAGPIEERVRQVLTRARWRHAGNVEGRPVFDRPARQYPEKGDPLEQLTAVVDRGATDRAAVAAAVARASGAPDDESAAAVGDVVAGMLESYQRRVTSAERGVADGLDGAAAELDAARKAYRATLDTLDLVGNRPSAQTAAGRAWREAGLGRVDAEVKLPPELDEAYAPEMLRTTVERYFDVGGRQPSQLEGLVDGFYRPYLTLFKTYATVGRGPGYHVRNLVGAWWNNLLGGVDGQDYSQAARLLTMRHQVRREVADAETTRLARELGLSKQEAAVRVDPVQLEDRAEQLLRERAGEVTVAEGVTLADVHDAVGAQQVSRVSRVSEGLHDVLSSETPDILAWQRGRGGRNLFGRPPGELNAVQRAANVAASNRWVRWGGDASQLSEDYVRTAAFIRGAKRYGMADGGRSAGLLSKGLHFDYDDLSDFERVWMRGFAIPFYTWTRYNVPLQARALMQDPGRMQQLAHANDALRSILGDEEEDIVPEWMGERMGWASRFTWGGSPVLIGVESPATDLNRWLKVGRPAAIAEGMTREFVSGLSPGVKVPIELALQTNTFTGAPFNPAGETVPSAARWVPGLPTRVDDEGNTRAPTWAAHLLRSTVPPFGQADRVLGLTPGSRERLPSSLISNLFPVVTSATLTPGQKTGELRARADRLRRAVDWSGVDPEVVEQVRELVRRGYPPEMIERMVAGAA